ncbi:hypothetical protein ZWY2020_033880 [Hordeum vulgare]|nr:hypothetical protein ZWY2020_033880 [Hordeum vulgare]
MYQHGSTRLLVVPTTHEQRLVIRPEGEKGWDHPPGVRKPHTIFGVLCRENFLGFVTLCGEGELPTLGFTWEHYHTAQTPMEEIIDGVLCHTRVEMAIKRFWAHHNKMEVPHLYGLYGMAHTASYEKAKAFSESDLDQPEKFTTISSHHKLVRYKDEGKKRRGEEFNPSQEPFDPELVMISSGGRPHGSIAIGDGLIHCPLTLSEVKEHHTSSCPEIRPHPRPLDLSIEATLEKERVATQTLLEERDLAAKENMARLLEERDRAAKENTTRLLEEERAQNEAANRAMYNLLVSVCLQNGQTPPPMPDISGVGTVSFISTVIGY